MRRITPSIAILTLCLMCALPANAAGQAAPLPVVVSIPAQKYMLERIAGDAVAVTVLVKPGADPHSYEPTAAQMRQCAAARLYFTIGVPFEDAWLPRVTGAAPDLATVSTISGFSRLRHGEGIPGGSETGGNNRERKEAPPHSERGSSDRGRSDHEHSAPDPHVWLSPMLVRQMLPVISQELGKALPERAADFRRKARAFSDELARLDLELVEKFTVFPPDRRVFLTVHPSWGYFARNYRLAEYSIEVEGKEPGPRSMKALVDLARKHGISTIFVEPQFPAAAASAIADSIGAEIVRVDPLAEDLPALYRDMAAKLADSFRRSEIQR